MARPSITLKGKLKLIFYRILTGIFDFSCDWLQIFRAEQKKFEDKVLESDQWDDQEILRRYHSMPSVEETDGEVGAPCVVRICNDTIVTSRQARKLDSCHEVLTADLIRSKTSIPTPRIRRTIVEDGLLFMVMEYVEGKQLLRCWPSMSFWSKLRAACILRQYIRQLRSVRDDHFPIPGPLAASPHFCLGNIFAGRIAGPFPDYASLSNLFNRKLREAQSNPRVSADPNSDPFDDSASLVLTHNDLNMRNIMMGNDGKIWMIDWGWSGYFPVWFEYIAMIYASDYDDTPGLWKKLIPFITDPYFEQEHWMEQVYYIIMMHGSMR